MVLVKIKGKEYDIVKSTKKDKKLMVISPQGVKIHFGAVAYSHYKDLTGIWKSKDHNDKTRQEAYLKRSKGILNKQKQSTYNNPESPNFFARYILWSAKD